MAIKLCDNMISQRTTFESNRMLLRTTSVDNSKSYKISKSVQVEVSYGWGHFDSENIDATSQTLEKDAFDVNATKSTLSDNSSGKLSNYTISRSVHVDTQMLHFNHNNVDATSQTHDEDRFFEEEKDTLNVRINKSPLSDNSYGNLSEQMDDLKEQIQKMLLDLKLSSSTLTNKVEESQRQLTLIESKDQLLKTIIELDFSSQRWLDLESDLVTKKQEHRTKRSLLQEKSFLFQVPQLKQKEEVYPLTPHQNELNHFSNELTRFSTYHNFSSGINISATRLAEAGFYKLGESTGNKTKCFSCGIEYDEWKSGDQPLSVHIRLSPHCSHVKQISQNRREAEVKYNDDVTHYSETTSGKGTGSSVANDEKWKNNLTGVNKDPSCSEDITVRSHIENIAENPRYPNYASMQARISSYRGWPSYLDQTAEQMASAGFLFAGFNDYTRCFQCGGGLRNWDVGDDPWIEHARWFSKCSYLRQNKGDRFIEKVQQKHAELMAEGQGANNSPSTTGQTSTQSSNPKDLNRTNGLSEQEASAAIAATSRQDISSVAQSDINQNLLGTIAARSVLEMGYSPEQVLSVYSKYKNKGKDLNTICATDIMYVLLDGDIEISHSQLPTDTNQLNDNNKEAEQGPSQQQTSEKEHRSLPKDKKGTSANVELENHLDDTEQLLQENRQLRDQMLCKICLDLNATIAFLPCGHIVCCQDCAPAMRKCPICRTRIKGTVKTYLV